MRIGVVVPAYNEELNVAILLNSILDQQLSSGSIIEIVVVASGCTDETEAAVHAVARGDRRIRVMVQEARQGKVAAINAYLAKRDPSTDIVVIASADIVLRPDCLESLVGGFRSNERLGMAGGHPRPVNRRDALLGRMVHFLWDLHHERASQQPKLGELVAVRANLLEPLDEQSCVDEAAIEARVSTAGYQLAYVPSAAVANRGPNRLGEYFAQRRRIAAGHFRLKRVTRYRVSTLDWRQCAGLALRKLTLSDPKASLAYLTAIAIEVLARALGYADALLHRTHVLWKVASSAHQAIVPAEEDNSGPAWDPQQPPRQPIRTRPDSHRKSST